MAFLENIWVLLWIILGLAVVGLALYRKMLSSHEVDVVHVTMGESRIVNQQATFAQKLDRIDFWGKTLTIVLAVYGLILGAWMLYQMWEQSGKLSN